MHAREGALPDQAHCAYVCVSMVVPVTLPFVDPRSIRLSFRKAAVCGALTVEQGSHG